MEWTDQAGVICRELAEGGWRVPARDVCEAYATVRLAALADGTTPAAWRGVRPGDFVTAADVLAVYHLYDAPPSLAEILEYVVYGLNEAEAVARVARRLVTDAG